MHGLQIAKKNADLLWDLLTFRRENLILSKNGILWAS